jgi:hypothetical protein
MTPQEKPEWFELSEGEGSANVRRVSKTLPIAAVIATMAILGIGGVVAQTQDPSLASAIEVTSQPQTQTQSQTQSATTADSVAVSAAASAPAIAMPPTGRGDDDEDDDEGDDDEHHKSRNSHGDDDDDDRFGDDD